MISTLFHPHHCLLGGHLRGRALALTHARASNHPVAKADGEAEASALARQASRREDELRRVLREEIDKETERQAILSGGLHPASRASVHHGCDHPVRWAAP